ncbi:polymer-forming cytoskeletal protein [Patescibacteria group bacterium]
MLDKNQSTLTIIDPSAKLKGKFASNADIVVKGRIDGIVESTQNIEIRESANIKANVKAINIIVAGNVEDSVEAIERLDITKTGKIIGDIKCKVLNIERGGKFDGKCIMPVDVSK